MPSGEEEHEVDRSLRRHGTMITVYIDRLQTHLRSLDVQLLLQATKQETNFTDGKLLLRCITFNE